MHRPILIASSLALLAGCGGGTPANQPAPAAPGQPSAQNVPPVPQTGDVSISTPSGQVDVRSGAGAAAYPDGIPQYPGATADQSATVSGAGAQGGGRILGFRTADPAAQVISFYADAAGRAGYRVLTRMDSGATATLVLQRGADNVSISATRIGDFTQAQIVAANRGPG